MRGMLVGKPVAAVEVVTSDTTSLDVGAALVMLVVGAKTMLVETTRDVAESVPVGRIEYGALVDVAFADDALPVTLLSAAVPDEEAVEVAVA
jgi:hypothetical protein